MMVYYYDPYTGVYDNRGAEVTEIPPNATTLVPPSPPDPRNQWSVFRDGAWHVEDKPDEEKTSDASENIVNAPTGHLLGGPTMVELFSNPAEPGLPI